MKTKLFKGLMLMTMLAALLVTVSCQKKVETAAPEVPKDTSVSTTATPKAPPPSVPSTTPMVDSEKEAFTSEDINFAFDDSSLSATAQEILQRKAAYMKKNAAVNAVIEGHCDERGTTEYNIALGDRRAQSAKSFLVDLGVASTRLTTISYGEEMPVDPRQTEEAYAKNRRAHFLAK